MKRAYKGQNGMSDTRAAGTPIDFDLQNKVRISSALYTMLLPRKSSTSASKLPITRIMTSHVSWI